MSSVEALNEWTEITAPYLDRNNDYLQIYLRQEGDGYVLTDDGATIEGLLAEGCSLDSPKRKAHLKMTLAEFGVSEQDGCLIARATSDTFALKKRSLVQAMLAVSEFVDEESGR